MLKISPKIYKSTLLVGVALIFSGSTTWAIANNSAQNTIQVNQDIVENKKIIKEKIQENQKIRQEQREETHAQIQENVQQRKQTREEKRAGLAQGHANRLSTRFSAYYNRLTSIMGKMKNRYEMMSDNSKDMTIAIAKLEDASVKLEAAKTAGEQAIAKFSSVPVDELKIQLTTVKDATIFAQEARATYREAVVLFQESIQLAKQAANQ